MDKPCDSSVCVAGTTNRMRSFLWASVPFIVPPAIVVGIAYWHYRSFEAMEAHRSGFVLYSPHPVIQVEASPGATIPVVFQIQNVTWKPTTIEAASASCTCSKVVGLPLTIPSGETRELRVNFTATRSQGGIAGNLSLYTLPAGNPCQLAVALSANDSSN